MNAVAILTKRETEVAELFAWGAAKKEVAGLLNVSERTVENHARNIYIKTGCGKVNELSAWWFCTRFHISFDLSPLKRALIAGVFLALTAMQSVSMNSEFVRVFRAKTVSVRGGRTVRRRSDDDALDFVIC